MRYFNTAGPSVAGQHYMIDPLQRLDLSEVLALIEQQRYFVLHAPRQTGKTTCLLALMQYLNTAGRYRAVYANIEGAQAARADIEHGIAIVCSVIAGSTDLYLRDETVDEWLNIRGKQEPSGSRLTKLLRYWSEHDSKPTILLLDEIDSLVGDTLLSVLRQLRAGYAQRPGAFPQAVILCGVRDVRDYRIHTAHQEIITGGSAFNIKAKSLRLGNLERAEVERLYTQHTAATGQIFDPKIFAELWEDTQGQPWLVNALGHEMTWEDRELRDRSIPIDYERYQAAREHLIQSRATHLDQLAMRLEEPRVRPVIAALLEGEDVEARFPDDDLQYLTDLGLIRRKPQLVIANRIYREILPREITAPIQDVLTQDTLWYLTQEHRLDMHKLFAAFQQFFREHSEAWLERFDYQEAGPHLLLQAFLQRIVNGGGRVNREYGLGRRRTDLFLEWPLDEQLGFRGPVQRVVIELKLIRKAFDKTLRDGIEQTADYADRCGADEAHLLLFDRRVGRSWEERIWQRTEVWKQWTVKIWGA